MKVAEIDDSRTEATESIFDYIDSVSGNAKICVPGFSFLAFGFMRRIMLEVKNLNVSYGVIPVLHDVSLQVQGE